MTDYEFEDLRTFIIRRSWLHGDDGHVYQLVSTTDYQALLRRELALSVERAAYIRAFRDGYLTARPTTDWRASIRRVGEEESCV